MSAQPSEPLAGQHCKPCEGGVPKLTAEQIQQLLPQIPQWQVDPSGDAITRSWKFRDFVAAILDQAEIEHDDSGAAPLDFRRERYKTCRSRALPRVPISRVQYDADGAGPRR